MSSVQMRNTESSYQRIESSVVEGEDVRHGDQHDGYQHDGYQHDGDQHDADGVSLETTDASSISTNRLAKQILANFVVMALLFSANHGCVVACLSLASARLGSVGAWQSGILYLAYTGSALFGATYFVKNLGPKKSLMAGMGMYCAYVLAFWIATVFVDYERPAALIGAAIGGVGAGFLWTAQGAYFARASEEHALLLNHPTTISNSNFAGIFAFIYLASEVLLRSLSTVLQKFGGFSWSAIFLAYTAVTIVSTLSMLFVQDYGDRASTTIVNIAYSSLVDEGGVHSGGSLNDEIEDTAIHQALAAWNLLINDPKMKYMIGLNTTFGFAAAFLNSYVNGEVTPVVTKDDSAKYIGLLTAWTSIVAACASLVFGRIIANIIVQNGLSSAIGYILTFSLECKAETTYCVRYRDGSLHNVLLFELLILVSAVVAVFGYWRATILNDESARSVAIREEHD